MEHKFFYDEDNQILRMQIIGGYSTEDAHKSLEFYNSHLEGKPYRQLIVDLSQAGKMESRETRKIQNEILKQSGITDTCYVGANAATRMTAKVLMKLGGLDINTNFVKNDEDAIAWLMKMRGKK
jgi:hypothetical protein